jgi:hypothetical protein
MSAYAIRAPNVIETVSAREVTSISLHSLELIRFVGCDILFLRISARAYGVTNIRILLLPAG